MVKSDIMNIKKTLTIAIIALAIFSTITMASAGLFDFGDDSSIDDGQINGTIIDYKFRHSAVTTDAVTDSLVVGVVTYDGYVTIDLGDLPDEKLSEIENNLNNSKVKCNISTENFGAGEAAYGKDTPRIFYIDESNVEYSLKDNILNITFSYSNPEDAFGIEDDGSRDLNVVSGFMVIPTDGDDIQIKFILPKQK